jgi:hypothetical protein
VFDAGDRRLRLADARGDVALAQASPDALGDQDLYQGGMHLNRVHSAVLGTTAVKCKYRIIKNWKCKYRIKI